MRETNFKEIFHFSSVSLWNWKLKNIKELISGIFDHDNNSIKSLNTTDNLKNIHFLHSHSSIYYLPEGSNESTLLNEEMILKLNDILPPNAICKRWIMIYSSKKDGFLLSTFYRKMKEFEADTPILLIINDMNGHTFGGIASTKFSPSGHHYGIGHSSMLFRFINNDKKDLQVFNCTERNDYFIMSENNYLSMGISDGNYGLWLDFDFNRGISQKCDTYDNEPLAFTCQKNEFFKIKNIEAFGFYAI